mgnify:CR=1 FL=1
MPTTYTDIPTTIEVSPHRLEFGRWCHHQERTIGEGDISASYSGDLIALKNRVRQPFRLQGWLCVAVGIGPQTVKAYRLLSLDQFTGAPTTYREKLRANHGDDARRDPNGFYHGMRVQRGGSVYVLCGPPISIVPGQPEPTQSELF